MFDSDSDMKISINDFKHAMETMGEKMDPEEINEIIADSELVDSDYIDINKFAQMIMNRIWNSPNIKPKIECFFTLALIFIKLTFRLF